jgi:hypothetical protein
MLISGAYVKFSAKGFYFFPILKYRSSSVKGERDLLLTFMAVIIEDSKENPLS